MSEPLEQYTIRVTDPTGVRFIRLDCDDDIVLTNPHYGDSGLLHAWLSSRDTMEEVIQEMINGTATYISPYTQHTESCTVEIIRVEMNVTSAEAQNMNPTYAGKFILRDRYNPDRYYVGDTQQIWEREIRSRPANIHRATKFNSSVECELVLREMSDLEDQMENPDMGFTHNNYEIISL